MNEQRIIIEMGMGNDQYGIDCTKAAGRAIEDAIRHSSLPIIGALGISHDQMRVQVTAGVQEPAKVDTDDLTKRLPRGRVTVNAVQNGMNTAKYAEGNIIAIASAALEAFLPSQVGNYTLVD